MNIEEFKEVILKVKDYTNTICIHVKGEPLLHENINEILSICDNNNINVSLTTNGTLLKNKIEKLKNHKSLTKIHISLNAEVKSLSYIEDIFDSVSLLSQSQIIIYRFWAQKEGILDEKSTKVVKKLKNYYNLSKEVVENIKTNKNVKIDINKYVDKDSLFVWPSKNNNKTNNFCEGLKSQLAILSDGTVTTCCLDVEG